MAYEKQTFENNATVLSAEHMQHIEDGIYQNSVAVEELNRDKLDASALPSAINTALEQAAASGEFDGADGKDGNDGVGIASMEVTQLTDADVVVDIWLTDNTNKEFGLSAPQGKDGTSVTVKSVSESTADGGSNVVTFSDGKTLTVKNGTKGSTGADGKDGADGEPGKSAFAYAQDGGYTGTEAAFAAKLAKEIPTALPNPKPLTFTDGVSEHGSYNGSEEKTIFLRRVVYVDITMNDDGSGSASMPFAQIKGYIDLGYAVCCKWEGVVVPLVGSTDENAAFAITMAIGYSFQTIAIEISADGSVAAGFIETTSFPNPNALTFTGAVTGTYDGSAAMTVNIPTVPTALKNPNALTFTGGVTGTYDGSTAKTVNIPIALKNPNALTFTGAATGTYDGSAAKTVNIPTVPTALKNPNALTINGTSYDGSKAVNLTIEGGVDSPYKGKTMSVIGASFEAYGTYIPAEADVWWRKLANALEMTVLVANGVSGSVVCGATEGSTAGCGTRCVSLHSGDTKPDVVFVSFGGNDFKLYSLGTFDPATTAVDITTSRTISTFREAYAVMVGKIMNAYPQAEVYCLTRPLAKAMPYTNTAGDTLQMWNDAIVDIATKMGATPIRMEYCGITRYNRSIYAPVENHPNAEGQSLMANRAIQTVDPSCAVRYGVTESDTPGDSGGSGDTGDSGSYTNLIPTALDTDLDGIYNEIGYKNGAYVSTETNASTGTKWAAGTVGRDVATGLFPYSSLSPVDGSNTYKPPTIYMKGVTFSTADAHCRILLMNGTTFVQCLYLTKTLTSNWTVTELGTNYYKLEPIMSADGKNAFTTNGYNFTHIAISAIGYGENWVITFDEPIE